jgi:arylsulfatase
VDSRVPVSAAGVSTGARNASAFSFGGINTDDEPLPPVKLNSGYYATTAIAQHAIEMLTGHQATNQAKPFFLYLAFNAPPFPLQALPKDFALYQDRYRAGWDALRQERFARMTKMRIINCPLSKLQPDIAPSWNLPEQKLRDEIGSGEVGRAVAWDSLTAEERKFQPIKMALHAAMIHRMDIEIGRVLDQLGLDRPPVAALTRAVPGTDDDVAPFGAPSLEALDFHPEKGQTLRELLRGQLDVDVVPEPREGDPHRNRSINPVADGTRTG